jgi:hypothetical protein
MPDDQVEPAAPQPGKETEGTEKSDPPEPDHERRKRRRHTGEPAGDEVLIALPEVSPGVDLREAQEEVRELRAASYASGGAFGRDQNNYFTFDVSGTRRHWQVGLLTADQVERIRRTFAGTPSRNTLVNRLAKHRVCVLRGRRGSGRRTTALMALSHHTDGLALIGGPSAPAALGIENLRPGYGHVYDATGKGWTKRLTEPEVFGCRETLATLDARLVILVSDDVSTTAVEDCTVDYEPPDPYDVLARHLRHALPDQDIDVVLARITDGPGSPQEAAQLAAALAEGIAAGRTVEEILASRPHLRRVEARALLRQYQGDEGDRDLGKRAFIISCAVLEGLSAVQICRAAQRLATRLFEIESPDTRAKLSLLPFGAILDEWLPDVRNDPPDYVDEMDRRLKHRGGFAEAVMDVVWFDYVVAHDALLSWLEELGSDRDLHVRFKAAQTLGRLAAYDFDFIEQRCFVPWSEQRKRALHEMTAWALEAVIASRPQRREKVLARTERWANGSLTQQSTAAALFGTFLGVHDPARAMRSLRQIMVRSPDELRDGVIASVVNIFAGGSESAVVEALGGWARSPQPAVRRAAALALAEISCLARVAVLDSAGNAGRVAVDSRPPLLALYEQSPEPVIDLWLHVLTARTCGKEPWNALRSWQKSGVAFSGLRDALEREPRLRLPLRFHLGPARTTQLREESRT